MIELAYIIPSVIISLLLLLILAPLTIIFINLPFSFSFYIYKLVHRQKYETSDRREFWNRPVTILARFYQIFGRVMFGYRLDGIEKIPTTGPVVLIMYHAELPYDGAFILSEIYLKLGRKVIQIVERLNAKFPGYKSFSEATEQTPGTRESCVQMLNEGEIIGIYPGGMREAFLSDSTDYAVNWNNRTGFAHVATSAQATIVPIFTKNCREIYFRPSCFKEYFKKKFLETKTTPAPVFGLFPGKLVSYVGDPIPFEESRTAQELADLTKSSMERLIAKNQTIPGSILRALRERLC